MEDEDEQFDWLVRDKSEEVERVVRRLVSLEITEKKTIQSIREVD